MIKQLNKVEVSFAINGKNCYLVDLSLTQEFNAHHSFIATVDYEELDNKWMESPGKIIQLIGQDVRIEMKHTDGSGINLFSGIITNVAFVGRHGQQNHIQIKGSSPTIRLDGSKTMDSFTDKTLKAIINESVDNSGNGGKVTASPLFSGQIDYICQYNETAFEFLNRMSWLYGEWFFYDGITCFFGKPDTGRAEVITYDTEMEFFNFSANLLPSDTNRYHYLIHDNKEINRKTPQNIPGVTGYHITAKERSSSIYTSEATVPLEVTAKNAGELEKLVEADKTRSVAEMLIINGTTQTSKVKIGKTITIKLPQSMDTTKKEVGTFLVTAVVHEYNQKGEYRNHFKGIPSEMKYIPMTPVRLPKAGFEIATVSSNADIKGRVKVQFQWQKYNGKVTNWIRVQTPDAGSSGDVPKNRGYVFIPEGGDQVMIGYEYGDPNRPFVTGSMFPENQSEGGYADNRQKSIMTRSGIKIVFNDMEESLHIEDPSGNTWHMDGKGNITVNAPETITMNAKNVRVNAEEDITMSAGKDIQSSAGENMSDSAGETHTIQSKNKNIFVQENSYTDIKKDMSLNIGANSRTFVTDDVNLTGGKILVDATDADMFVNATGKITLKSGDIVDIAQ